MPTHHFKAELQAANEAGRWVLVPEAVAASFAIKRPAVKGTVNGIAFRSRLSVYGGKTYLGFTAPVRRDAGAELGDRLAIALEADDTPREVDVPVGLQSALAAQPAALAIYEGLSFSHRKEYARWIADAKREETRERRIGKTVEMLLAGRKTPD